MGEVGTFGSSYRLALTGLGSSASSCCSRAGSLWLSQKGSRGRLALGAFAGVCAPCACEGAGAGRKSVMEGNVKVNGEVVEDAEEEGMLTVMLANGFWVGAEVGVAELGLAELGLDVLGEI